MPGFDFTRMFNPRGIAIVGANTDLTRPGRQTVLALERHGYKGGVYPVNPKYEEIGGKKCFPSLADIDGPCDVAVVAIPAAQVPGVIAQCGNQGISFAVVLGGGFREAGPEGVMLERKMLDAAHSGGVRIVGPNCLGFKNVHDHVFAGFGSITRPPDLEPGPVSAVIQSGGFGNSVVMQAGYAGIGFRYLVASGGESDIKAPEMIDAFIDDPQTRIIFAYLEGVEDGRAFMSAARRALVAGKPLVVMKAGNTRQGLRAAASHTAFMTVPYDVYRAAFKQCGVIEAKDIQDTVDILQCLVGGRLARGRNVAVMSCSGGSLVNFSDAADDNSLTLAPLTETTRSILKENLPSIASVLNPVDCTAGFDKEANAPLYKKCIEALLADPGVDQLGPFMATAAGVGFSSFMRALISAPNPLGKPIFVFSAMPPSMTAEGREILKAARIPVFGTPRRLATSMALLADYAHAREQCAHLTADCETTGRALPVIPPGAQTLDEHASKRILGEFGIAVTRDELLLPDPQAFRLPPGFEFPVAAKIVSRDIAHKTDIGAVKLNIRNDADLALAAKEVLGNARKAIPTAAISGVLVSEMVNDGLETIIGVVNDPIFGPVVAFGLGGILAETLRDTTHRIAPFGIDVAREMIGELRASHIFSGVRGQAQRDVDALARMLVTISEFAWLMRDRLIEMDINPVLVRPAGLGAVAADALIALR
jgi:acyl-CoA synthetase (NDP forming)